ncbi:alpha/beta hydrolase [Pseudonocardia sp. RS11V-5]|uniref:alpha/beta hydrolase family protein n=1 Tax=Pseudonocardia terrae TaxID=2905831 RepID=UPI001E4DF5FA|nr:alpha/beta family hydrolase [Pseudonocardia terrae]MCE3550232.1 alpha/beta hydrolase [Pseudonocardia terrae]
MTNLRPAEVAEVPTPHGPARVHVRRAPGTPRGALLMGHGAGGGVDAPDLRAAARAALDAGLHVVLVEQPYRVAGRRAPAPATQLDAAWEAVVGVLRGSGDVAGAEDCVAAGTDADASGGAVGGLLAGLPLLFGGRSSGARVACRCAAAGGAVGIVCLAFPVHPPGKPEKHRRAEIDGVTVPVLVVQGESDPFGRPEPTPTREVVLLPGDHSLKKDVPAVEKAVADWLSRHLP